MIAQIAILSRQDGFTDKVRLTSVMDARRRAFNAVQQQVALVWITNLAGRLRSMLL